MCAISGCRNSPTRWKSVDLQLSPAVFPPRCAQAGVARRCRLGLLADADAGGHPVRSDRDRPADVQRPVAGTDGPVVDGPLGQTPSETTAEKIRIMVPGDWFALGEDHTYSTTREIKSFADLKGLQIRIPGTGLPIRCGARPCQSPGFRPWPSRSWPLCHHRHHGAIWT